MDSNELSFGAVCKAVERADNLVFEKRPCLAVAERPDHGDLYRIPVHSQCLMHTSASLPALLDQRLEQRLGADRVLAPEAHAAVAEPARFDVGAGLHAGIRKRAYVRLTRQVGETLAGMLLEGGGIGANYMDVAHGIPLVGSRII